MAEKIEARYLNEKIKMGWTTANFAEHYNCSEEYFEYSVKLTFSEKSSEDLLRRIRKNDERAEKQLKRRAQVGQKERKDKDARTLLKEAETAEAQVQTRIDKLKALHENLETKQRNLEEGLTRHDQVIACIEESLKRELQRKEATMVALKKVTGELKSIQDKLSNQYDRMKSIKEQKADLRKVEMLVYKNGTLEIDSIDHIELTKDKDQEGWKEVLSKLMEQKEADMISVGELKMLSKLVVLAAQLRAEERIFEITFENELAQELFNMIMC